MRQNPTLKEAVKHGQDKWMYILFCIEAEMVTDDMELNTRECYFCKRYPFSNNICPLMNRLMCVGAVRLCCDGIYSAYLYARNKQERFYFASKILDRIDLVDLWIEAYEDIDRDSDED